MVAAKPGAVLATTDVPKVGVVVETTAPKAGVAAAVDPPKILPLDDIAGAPNVCPPPPNIVLPVELLL